MADVPTTASPPNTDTAKTPPTAERPEEEAGGTVLGRVRLVRRVVRVAPLAIVERYGATPSSVSMNV